MGYRENLINRILSTKLGKAKGYTKERLEKESTFVLETMAYYCADEHREELRETGRIIRDLREEKERCTM